MNKIKAFACITAVSLSPSLWAHSGHDHNGADAGLIHLLWLSPAILAIGVHCYRKFKENSMKNNQTK